MRTLFVLIGISIFYTCGKPTEPITETTPGAKVIDKTITNAMYFKVGSYWIYESDRGLIDSVWVDSRSSINFYRDNKTQVFNTYLFSSIEQNSRIIWCEFQSPDQVDTQYRIQIASYFRGSSSGLINADIFRPTKGSTNTCKTCTGDTAILMSGYTINGKKYTNVWRFLNKAKDSICIANPNCGNYFMAENVGIIQKFENVGGAPNNFKLKRYHIVK